MKFTTDKTLDPEIQAKVKEIIDNVYDNGTATFDLKTKEINSASNSKSVMLFDLSDMSGYRNIDYYSAYTDIMNELKVSG